MVNKTLSNQAGVNLIGKWKIEDGKIINADNSAKGFGVLDDGKATGTKVTVDETLTNDDPGQQWKKSSLDDSGYFTLMNINSGKFLSAVSTNNITIQGMYVVHFEGKYFGWNLNCLMTLTTLKTSTKMTMAMETSKY